jgi:hypothetical protein
MKHAKYIKLFNKSTAWAMRPNEPWFGSERTVAGDDAFGQVREVVTLRDKGLYVLCNIKQCHKFFPKSRLEGGDPCIPEQQQVHLLDPEGYSEDTKREGSDSAGLWVEGNNKLIW